MQRRKYLLDESIWEALREAAVKDTKGGRESREKGSGLEGEGAERRSHVIYTVTMATMESMICICT